MDIIGYVASLFIGISLGLIGGGGSILTVPVLVYLFHIEPVTATAYSLFIVGSTSIVGMLPKYRQGFVDTRTAIVFGIPSIIAVFMTRKYIVPAIPAELFKIGDLVITKNLLLMVLFATLMLFASYSMIRGRTTESGDIGNKRELNYPLILIEGAVVGVLTGMVGAGGGFLIIPALVLFSGLPMKKSVGTSLLIIGAKSLIGFTGDISNYSINWTLLITITSIAIAGIFIGNRLIHKIASDKLKKCFGWFILFMSLYILLKETVLR